MAEPFESGSVRGFLHRPEGVATQGLVITHGAGGNCEMALLKVVASIFAEAGFLVLRCDLPFRQKRAKGAPFPSGAAADRAGLRDAVEAVKAMGPDRVYLGGQSYGGRQATMVASEQRRLAAGLLLFSYPLHPPGKPEQLRTAHFPALKTPAVFVHGTRDPFGSIEEMRTALPLIPAQVELIEVAGAGHDLKGGRFEMDKIVRAIQSITK